MSETFPTSSEKASWGQSIDNSHFAELPDGTFQLVTSQMDVLQPVESPDGDGTDADPAGAPVGAPEIDLAATPADVPEQPAPEDTPVAAVPSGPVAGSGQPQSQQPIKVVLSGDTSYAAGFAAKRLAEAKWQLESEEDKGGKIRNIVNKMWKNATKGYLVRKYTREERQKIAEDGGDFSDADTPAEARTRDRQSKIAQLEAECVEAIHTDAGEKKEVLANDHELAIGTKDLIRRYHGGEFDGPNKDKVLAEARTRMLNDYRAAHPGEDIGPGIADVDNLLEIAKSVSGAVEHGESLDHVLENMQVIIGELRPGVRGEVKYNLAEKVLNKLESTKIGQFVVPAFVVGAVSIGMSVCRWGGQAITGRAAKLVTGVSIIGGLWAGIRENAKMKEDRINFLRDKAEGKVYDENDKHRVELEKSAYEMVSANSLTEQLKSLTDKNALEEGGPEAVQTAMDTLVAVEMRIKYSDKNDIPLLSYTNPSVVGDERMSLDIARANLKAMINHNLTPEMQAQIAGSEKGDFKQLVNARCQEFTDLIEQDVTEKDKAFNKMKRRHVAGAFVKAALIGAGIGIVMQEGLAFFDPTRANLVEQVIGAKTIPVNGETHETLMAGLVNHNPNMIHTGPNPDFVTEKFGGQSLLSVSSEHNIVNNGNGTFNLLDPNGHATAENIRINPDGSLPKASIDQLHSLGMDVNDKSVNTSVLSTSTETVNTNKFIDFNLDKTTEVARDSWYDNNTPGHYDLNELKLWWGEHGGVTHDGYQFNVSHMTEGGSFHNGQSVDWAEAAKEGHLKMAISASTGTQNHVFMVDIDSKGNFNIDKDSPAGQFFSESNGQAHFNGAYAEVVEMKDVDVHGVQHMVPLATVVGEHNPGPLTIEETIERTVKVPIYEIITNGYDTTTPDFVEMSPVIPIAPRRNMGSAKANYETEPTSEVPGYYGYRGGEALTAAEIEQRKKEISPRLRENPDADLVPGEEFDFYEKLLVEQKGQEYVDGIKSIVASTPELANLDEKTKVLVTIPVNAAGDSEANNIYNLLTKGYGAQDLDGLKGTTMLLHVNWFDTYKPEDEVNARANIAKTKSEIQRAKDDMAALGFNVAVVETEYKRSEVQGGVIGYVARKMNDVVLLALNSAASSGRISKDHDVLIIRNDADARGVRHHYLKRYQEELEANKESDIFMGTTSFDQLKANRAPGLVLSGNFMQSFDIIAKSREGKIHTAGGNFGVKASMLAAVGSIGFSRYTGAASDDVEVGDRVKAARAGKLSVASVNNQYGSSGSNGNGGSSRKVGVLVHGARIDTDSDRGEKQYVKSDGGFVQQWNGGQFDKNGYEPRNKGLGAYRESLTAQPERVVENIRNDFETTINNMYESNAVTRSALTFAFPKSEYYQLSGQTPNVKFAITPAGAEYLKRHLISRDEKGRFAKSYGRKKREWYGEGGRRTSMIRVS